MSGCLSDLGAHGAQVEICAGRLCIGSVAVGVWEGFQLHVEVRGRIPSLRRCVQVTFTREVLPQQGWDMSQG